MIKIRVWDLPTRLFHWLLALLVIAAIVTVKIGGNALQWHFYCGYAVLSLLAFRVLWGVFGSYYARFSSFGLAPATICNYVRALKSGQAPRYVGHTPLGSLSVLAILGVILLQVSSGLFSNDDIASEGPLVKFISKEMSDRISWFHTDVNAYLIYGLIGVHIVAVFFYYVRKKEDLITPMVTGDKVDIAPAAEVRDTWSRRFAALLLWGVCAVGVYYLVNIL
jgi:cytochrome b